MRRSSCALVALALVLLVFSACRREGDVLLGQWQGTDFENGRQTFTFEQGGKARWKLEFQDKSQTFDLTYKLATGQKPWQLDLNGFTTGPLAGAALLCILEVSKGEAQAPDAMQLECWPGRADGKDSPRPQGFGPQTVKCQRVAATSS